MKREKLKLSGTGWGPVRDEKRKIQIIRYWMGAGT